jgi:hypothetical protein
MPTLSNSPFSIYYPSLDDPANIQDAFLIYHFGQSKNSLSPDTSSVAGYLTSLTNLKANIDSPTFTGTVTLPTGTTKVGNTSLIQGGTVNITLPTTAGTLISSGDTATVTNTMLAGSIANSKLSNSSVLIGDKTITLGATATTDLTGLTSVAAGSVSTTGNVTVGGNLTVNGTTTTVNSTTIVAKDKNIELSAVVSPTDMGADGGGITLRGTTDKTFNWVNLTSSWTSSENINLASGKGFKVNGSTVVDSNGAVNIAGGVVGTVPYQSATNTTSFVSIDGIPNGYVLTYNSNSAPTWSNPATLAAVNHAIKSDNLSGGSSVLYGIPYQSATDTTSFILNTTSTKKFISQTGNGTAAQTPVWDIISNADLPSALTGKTYNGLSLTSASTGFTISGGTTSKLLTVSDDATISGTHSGSSSGTNTGDQTITLTGDVTGSGTGSFATSIGTGKVTNAMLTGSIANNKLSNSTITFGTTSQALGSTISDIAGVTINSTTIPTNKTLLATDSTVSNGTATTAATGVGFMGIPQNSKSASYTLTLADAGKHIYMTTTGQTITIPANSVTAFPIGSTITIVNGSGVSTSITINSDTLVFSVAGTTTLPRTLAAWGVATLIKINTTLWIISGNGLS